MATAVALSHPFDLPVSVRQTPQDRAYKLVQSGHVPSASFPRGEIYVKESDLSQPATLHRTTENMQSNADRRCRDAIRAIYGGLKSSAKHIMRDAQCEERSARNILSGKSFPSGPALIRMMASNQKVFDAVCHAIGRIPQRPTTSEHELNQLRADVADLQRRIEELSA